MCACQGDECLRGARRGGQRDEKGGERGEVGEASLSGEPAGCRPAERAPLRPAPLAPPLPGRPSSRRAAATSSPDLVGREGTGEGLESQKRAGRPATGNVSLPTSLYSVRLELPLPRRGAEGD